jgi:hypothetical protein
VAHRLPLHRLAHQRRQAGAERVAGSFISQDEGATHQACSFVFAWPG